MPDQIPPETKARRNRVLRELGEKKFLAFKRSVVGQTLPVVALDEGDGESGLLHGVSDNYLSVLFAGADAWKGRLVQVRVEGMDPRGMLRGRVPGVGPLVGAASGPALPPVGGE